MGKADVPENHGPVPDQQERMIYVCPIHGRVEPWYEGVGSPRAGEPRCGDCVEEADHVTDVLPLVPTTASQRIADLEDEVAAEQEKGEGWADRALAVEQEVKRLRERVRSVIGDLEFAVEELADHRGNAKVTSGLLDRLRRKNERLREALQSLDTTVEPDDYEDAMSMIRAMRTLIRAALEGK